MNNFPYPNITGKTEAEQLTQIKSYLFQLVDQLNHSGINAANTETTSQNNNTGG